MIAYLKIAHLTIGFSFLCLPIWGQFEMIFKDTTLGIVDVTFVNADTGFVIGTNVNSPFTNFILKTVNGGSNWDTLLFPNEFFDEIDFPNADTGYIVLSSPALSVRRTIDGGQSWQLVADNFFNANSQLQIDFYNGMQGVISMPGRSFTTSNAGVTWTEITTNINGGEPNMIVKDSVYLGVGGNFMISSYDSCQNFSVLQNLYNQATPIYTQASGSSVDLDSVSIVIGASGQNGWNLGYAYFNYGVIAHGSILDTNFTVTHLIDINQLREVEIEGGVIYAVGNPFGTLPDGFIIKSSDGGATWFTQEIIEPGGFSYGAMEHIFCVNDTVCYTTSGGNIYKTTNGGGSPVNAVNTMVVGIEEYNSNTSSVILYPNPNNGSFTLTGLENIKYVEIVDLSGKLVKRITVNNKQANINLEAIESGIYFATIYTVTGTSIIKFIKQ